MADLTCDICVIGAGSAGLSVAYGASQMGARTVLIEAAEMGGDCLNVGCVPSKALLAAGKHAHAMTTGGPFGVAPVTPQVDFAAAKDHVAQAIATIAPVDSAERYEGLGVTVIRDRARFTSAKTVEAGGRTITARRFVVATGSRPAIPPIPGIEAVTAHTNETIFDLRDRPDHLVILGGGPIGMEMAQAHRRLGCDVTVVEAAKAMGRDDPEMVAIVLDRLRDEGIGILEDTAVTWVSGSDGAITLSTDQGDVAGSHLLVAAGRRAVVDDLKLDVAGVDHDKSGITVDAGLRSVSNRRVYAIGDVAGGLQFTHVAGYHAGIVIRSAVLGLPAKAKTDHIPWVSYTDPELAQVGLTEAQARAAHGDKCEIARFAYAENDRAIAEGVRTGQIKVMVVKGRPVGAMIVGSQAGELIGVWALAIANTLKMSALANMVAPYPTLGEISKRAAGAYFAPRLFENPTLKRVVKIVQRILP